MWDNGDRYIVHYYDALSRLKAATLPDNKIQEYTYDNLGNLTGLVEIGNDGIKDTTYQYDRNSRLLLQEEAKGDEVTKNLFDYDANGNQVEKNKLFYSEGKLIFSESSAFRFDGLNQLREAITTEGIRVNYSYNGNGMRYSKDVGGEITNFTYDLGNIILETDENGIPKARNFFGRSLISRQTADDVYYYLFNGHGDVVQLTDELGDILKDYRYDPFGRELDDQLPLMPGKPSVSLWRNEVEKLDNPFRYAGEYLDQETGLYYLRARYYDPQIQRFISEDSLAKSPNWQQHVYAYCGYNPVNFIDPSGNAYVWNRFGEIIGTTEGNDYTDYSQRATDTHGGTAEIVNRPWDGDSDAPEIGNLINNYYNEAINEVVKGNATWEDLSIVNGKTDVLYSAGIGINYPPILNVSVSNKTMILQNVSSIDSLKGGSIDVSLDTAYVTKGLSVSTKKTEDNKRVYGFETVVTTPNTSVSLMYSNTYNTYYDIDYSWLRF